MVCNKDCCVVSETTNQVRKEESPFSFKHFLKRDLSLPSTSASASASVSASNSYEGTGARPKVLASPHQVELQSRPVTSPHRVARVPSPHRAPSPQRTDPVSSPHRGDTIRVDSDNMAALGLPSLPDFVQDHLLLEQAYLGAGVPLDLDNLPDFTFTRPGFRPSAPPTRLALDLTDCVERPQPAPHPFPLDLPTASGTYSTSYTYCTSFMPIIFVIVVARYSCLCRMKIKCSHPECHLPAAIINPTRL